MVAPIGNIANKFNFPLTFSSTITPNSQQISLPTVFPTSSTGMDKSSGTSPSNNIKVRGRNFSTHTNLSKDMSMSSTHSSVIYHEGMMANNGMNIDSDPPTDSPALSHKTKQEKLLCSSKAAEILNNTRPQNRNNMALPFKLNMLDTTLQTNQNHVPQPLAMMTTMSSTFSYHMIPMLPLNQNCGAVAFI